LSAVDGYVAGAQRAEGDRVYDALLASGASRALAAECAADAAEAGRVAAMLDFYGAQHPEDV
jgi:hypothetical protein